MLAIISFYLARILCEVLEYKRGYLIGANLFLGMALYVLGLRLVIWQKVKPFIKEIRKWVGVA
jgi:hypothetical protein